MRALLAAGHRVIVPSRSSARLERLRTGNGSSPDALVMLTGEIGTPDGAVALRDRIARECGPLDALIPSLGGWWEGDLLGSGPQIWDTVMDEMLRTHYVFAHAFVPVLCAQPAGGRYIGIGGGATCYHPVRGSSLVSIAAAAQLMLTRALRQEIEDPKVDILELVVDGPVRTRDSASVSAAHWITAGEVGAIVAELVAHGRTSDPATHTSGPIVRMRPRRQAENSLA